MKSIIIFVYRDKFTDGFFSLFENYFDNEYHFKFYTLSDDSGKYPLSQHKNKIIELGEFVDIFEGAHKKVIESCDAFILSGLFVRIPPLYHISQRYLDKIWIDFWGGDYTCFRSKYFFRNPIEYAKSYLRLLLIRRCAGWILEMSGDYDEIKKHARREKKSFVAPILSPRDIEERKLHITKLRKEGEPLFVQLGNSGAEENCHIEILRVMSHLNKENIRIICPLSYGGKRSYTAKVLRAGKKYFGEKFIGLQEYLSKDKYFKLFEKIDIAIFNNDRQQGMGNIEEMLRQGKKVYMRTTTPMWDWYRGRGQKIYDVKSLKNITLEELAKFPEEYALNNLEVDMTFRRNKTAIQMWKIVLEEITSNG